MAECSDNHIRSLLHSYELGLLAEEERRELEMHLLDCPSCRKEIIDFQETILLVRQDTDIRKLIQRLDREEEETNAGETLETEPQKRRWLPTLIPASVVALVILFLLVLKPWQIEISPTQEAIAAGNRLAIMYFDNIADPQDPQRLGEILTNLLITDLAESRYIQVVSHQHLYDILKLLELENTKKINGETATRVAEKARARWMLMGNILQVQPQLVITAQLVEVESGNIIASQRVSGQVNENIFSLVDKLSAEIKKDMALPPEANNEVDRPVAEVTTHSPEAYKLYFEGVDDYYKFYLDDAAAKFKEALKYDSAFAMAYYYLAIIKDSGLIKKAAEYAGKASQKEQLYIKSRAALFEGNSQAAIDILRKMVVRFPDEKLAYFVMGTLYYSAGDHQLSIEAEKKALEIDPLYAAALNQLAYSYNAAGDTENALKTINAYIKLRPDEANPYDSRGELLARNGKYSEAVESYKMALEKRPDFRSSIEHLIILTLVNQDYDEAEKYTKQLIAMTDPQYDWMPGIGLAYIPQYQGKLEQTLRALDEGLAHVNKLKSGQRCPFHHLKAVVYGEQGRWDMALAEMEKCLDFTRGEDKKLSGDYLDFYIQMLARSGNIARAEKVADSLKVIADEIPMRLSDYQYALGAIQMARGNAPAAVDYFEKSNKNSAAYSYSVHWWLARAYLMAGLPDSAAKEYEGILSQMNTWRLYWGIWSVKAYYYGGMAYEQMGLTDKAIANYTMFLHVWKNADPGMAEMDDARARLARLKTKS